MKLQGRVAIVTGAARGIGLAIATRLSEAGAQVVLCDVLGEELHEAAGILLKRGLRILACTTDVSSVAGNQAAVKLALSKFGRIDIFHANAAVLRFTPLDAIEHATVDRLIEVNLKGAIYGCSAVIPTMQLQRSGVILLTSSVLASVGDPDLPVYGATKGALRALCKSLAVRHGPEGIRCNTISPGDVRTPLFEEFIAKSPDPSAARAAIIQSYPLRRIAEPDDVARLAVFLASDDASFITGSDVILDGGLMAQCY